LRNETPSDVLRLSLSIALGADEIARLQGLLESDSAERDARLSLMVAQRAPLELRVAQVRWFAEHEPRTFLGHHGWMAASIGNKAPSEFYPECKRLWFEQVELHRDDLDIVDNAAWFVILFDPLEGAALLDETSRGRADPEWDFRAFDYLQHASEIHEQHRLSFATRALEAGFDMFRHEHAIERRFDLLPLVRRCAHVAGRTSCEDRLRLAKSGATLWESADVSTRVQLGWVVRGFLSAAEEDLPAALDAFQSASAVELAPLRPLLLLASTLVSLGAVDVVVTEVKRWRGRYWKSDSALATWAEAIQSGDCPDPPKLREY
jgi:hypothetical protein